MTTAGARLAQLAGISGAAGVLLLAIGSGATAGAALVNYSGLPSATAAQHLEFTKTQKGGIVPYQDHDDRGRQAYIRDIERRLSEVYREDDEKILAVIMAFVTRPH